MEHDKIKIEQQLKADDRSHLNQFYPVTELVKTFWIAQEAHPHSSSYTIVYSLKLKGKLSLTMLGECINEMIKRHEILRTTFHLIDGELMQKVLSPFLFQINYIDLRNERVQLKETKVKMIREQLEKRVWEVDKLPLFYISVIHVDEDLFWMISNFNHLIFDGFSSHVFYEELSHLYNSYPNVTEVSVHPIQFIDYTLWINQRSSIEKEEDALNFFKSYLKKNEPIQLNLIKKDFSQITSKKSDLMGYELPPELSNDINEFAKENKVSKFVVMLSALFLLLSKLHSGEEVTIGLPVFGRSHPLLLKTLGLFVNTSLIAYKTNDQMTFMELIRHIEQSRIKLKQYEHICFSKLIDGLKPQKRHNRNNFFDVFFNYMPKLFGTGWKINNIKQLCQDFNSSETELLMTWYIFEKNEGNGLLLGCKTILELLDYSSINILFWEYHSLLEQVIKNPGNKLCSYSLVFRDTIDVYYRKLSQESEMWADFSSYIFYSDQLKIESPSKLLSTKKNLLAHYLIKLHAELNPLHPAIVLGETVITYAELIQTSNKIAHRLVQQGVSKGNVVAIHGETGLELCASIIAVWCVGGVILLIDATHPYQYKQMLVGESYAHFLIQCSLQREIETPLIFDPPIVSIDLDNLDRYSDSILFEPELSPTEPAYIFFTSGTTGKPKGIKGTHQGLSHFLNWQRTQFNIGPSDRCGQITNLSFDVVLRELFTTLTAGATLYIPPLSHGIESGAYLDWMEEHKITIQHLVPTLADLLLQNTSSQVTLKNLRWVFFAGEKLSQTLVNQWRQRFPLSGHLVNLYGPTETTLAKAFYVLPPNPIEGVQPIGKALPDTQLLILNKQNQLCGIGETGEICIRTPYRTLGYIHPSEEDKKRFFPNPFSNDSGDIIYRTGDLGFINQNNLVCICGRTDEQLKINGIRIDPSGIASMISTCSNVKQCVVIGKVYESGRIKLIAYIVPSKGSVHEDIRRQIWENMQGKLPNYMIPYDILFLDKIPVTPRGKLDKSALPEHDESQRANFRYTKTKPKTELEQTIAVYWQKEFAIDTVYIEDDFFELGANSIDGIKMMIFLRDSYQIPIKLYDIITHSSLGRLALLIEHGLWEQMNLKMTVQSLSQHVILPEIITEQVKNYHPDDFINNIFITGASGFLGAFLLNELMDAYPEAKFYCLIRAQNIANGLERIQDAFTKNQLSNLDQLATRIMPIVGDLASPLFGLSPKEFNELCQLIDIIYHSGALVNFVYNFEQLKPANIEGTKTVMELSTIFKVKPIHYVSTAGIYPSSVDSEKQINKDEGIIGQPKDVLIGGYVQTKWVSDGLMQKARDLGALVTIYRPGRISWDTQHQIWQEGDAIFRFIAGCIQLGFFPDIPVSIDLNPVNMVAKIIANISIQKPLTNKNYNIVNPNQVDINMFVAFLKESEIKAQIIPYSDWRNKLYQYCLNQQDNFLFPLLDLFAESLEDMPRLKYKRFFDCTNVTKALKETGIGFPTIEELFTPSILKKLFEAVVEPKKNEI